MEPNRNKMKAYTLIISYASFSMSHLTLFGGDFGARFFSVLNTNQVKNTHVIST
jgi:hypothetical protein